MVQELIYADREDSQKIEAKIRFSWVHFVLERMGIDLEDCFPDNDNPDDWTLPQKTKLRHILKINDIYIEDNKNEGLGIYVNNELVAEWKKPLYHLIYDAKQADPSKKYYVGITIEYKSPFEEEE